MATPDKDLADNLEKIRADIAALSGTVSKLVSDTSDIQSSLKKSVNRTAKEAASIGEKLIHDTAGLGGEAVASAKKSAAAAVDEVEGQIVRNPMAAVLVALGIGFVFGLISRK